jgi:hypothetical protein
MIIVYGKLKIKAKTVIKKVTTKQIGRLRNKIWSKSRESFNERGKGILYFQRKLPIKFSQQSYSDETSGLLKKSFTLHSQKLQRIAYNIYTLFPKL